MCTLDFSSLLKNCNTSRVKNEICNILANVLQILNDTPYSYIIWIYKHTIWKSASDIEYKEKLTGAKSGFEIIESRYYNPILIKTTRSKIRNKEFVLLLHEHYFPKEEKNLDI